MQEVLTENGIVEKISGNNVHILIVPSKECEECTAKIFCKSTSINRNILSVESSDKFEIGERVKIRVKGENVFLLSFFLYGLPLFILIVSLLVGLFIFSKSYYPEIYSFGFSLILLSTYFSQFNRITKHISNISDKPTIIKTDNSN